MPRLFKCTRSYACRISVAFAKIKLDSIDLKANCTWANSRILYLLSIECNLTWKWFDNVFDSDFSRANRYWSRFAAVLQRSQENHFFEQLFVRVVIHAVFDQNIIPCLKGPTLCWTSNPFQFDFLHAKTLRLYNASIKIHFIVFEKMSTGCVISDKTLMFIHCLTTLSMQIVFFSCNLFSLFFGACLSALKFRVFTCNDFS